MNCKATQTTELWTLCYENETNEWYLERNIYIGSIIYELFFLFSPRIFIVVHWKYGNDLGNEFSENISGHWAVQYSNFIFPYLNYSTRRCDSRYLFYDVEIYISRRIFGERFKHILWSWANALMTLEKGKEFILSNYVTHLFPVITAISNRGSKKFPLNVWKQQIKKRCYALNWPWFQRLIRCNVYTYQASVLCVTHHVKLNLVTGWDIPEFSGKKRP